MSKFHRTNALRVAALLGALLVVSPTYAGSMPDVVWSRIAHGDEATAVAFSADGTRVASGGGEADSALKIWDAATGDLLDTLGDHHLGVASLDFSADGTFVAVGHAQISSSYPVQFGVVYVWDLEQREIAHEFGGAFVKFSADGSRLLSGGWGIDRYLRVHAIPSGTQIADIYTRDYVTAATLSADGMTAASGHYDGEVQVWNVANGQLLDTLEYGGPVRTLAFSADGTRLAAGGQRSGGGADAIKVWNVSTGGLVQTLGASDAFISQIDFSADGRSIITCGSDSDFTRLIRIWRLSDGGMTADFDQSTSPYVNAVRFSRDGTRFVYGRGDGAIFVAEIESGAGPLQRKARAVSPRINVRKR